MASAAEDRAWVITQYEYLFGRKPTIAELDKRVQSLQSGMSRTAFMKVVEKWDAEASVIRLWKEVLGRDPRPDELAFNVNRLTSGSNTRAQIKEYLLGTSEKLLQPPAAPGTDPGKEDALAYVKGILDSYGLGSLGDWAWQQIQAGHTGDRVLQDLRQRDEYKQRFAGMEARQANGFSAISEGEYIAYENSVQQMMRAAGMPVEFYDQPSDFANMIGKNVSASEMQARINDGFLAASQAPADVKDALVSMYGLSQSDLAAFFLDPDRALPLIERQFQAAQIGGAATRTGFGAVSTAEAEGLAALGVNGEQAQQGFGTLADNKELFTEMVGETTGDISREDQLAAVFGDDADAKAALEQRAGARRSAGSGAQAFSIGQGGSSGLSRT